MSPCSVEDCGGKVHGYGLCRMHYSAEFKWKRDAWKKANPDKVREHKRIDSARHSKKIMERVKRWMSENPDKRKATVAKWDKANRDVCNAKDAKRRATKLNATPKWANAFFIKEAYHLAKLRTKMLGFKWEVDHIVPLQSKVVCGFHVENNLRVIPMVDNRTKSNTNWPNMPTLGVMNHG